jgi:hypothetical protein
MRLKRQLLKGHLAELHKAEGAQRGLVSSMEV